MNAYCDVSLPVPLDQTFTYELPETLRHRVQRGCRLSVPFGSRKLTGVVVRVHDDPPEVPARPALQLLDETPALDEGMLALGEWISSYYCAPLGEVLRGMMPLAGEIRRGKMYSLTDSGRDAAKQLLLGATDENPSVAIMRLLESRPISASYLKKKVPEAPDVLRSLIKKGFVEMEDVEAERDPMRASSGRLRVELERYPESGKFSKVERELLAYLELHPGSHNLGELDAQVRKASEAARALARRKVVTLRTESVISSDGQFRLPLTLNPHQLSAFQDIRAAIEAARVPPVSTARGDGIGEDGDLPPRHRRGACAGPGVHAAGTGDRADSRGGGAVLRSFRRPRGDSAFGLQRR